MSEDLQAQALAAKSQIANRRMSNRYMEANVVSPASETTRDIHLVTDAQLPLQHSTDMEASAAPTPAEALLDFPTQNAISRHGNTGLIECERGLIQCESDIVYSANDGVVPVTPAIPTPPPRSDGAGFLSAPPRWSQKDISVRPPLLLTNYISTYTNVGPQVPTAEQSHRDLAGVDSERTGFLSSL